MATIDAVAGYISGRLVVWALSIRCPVVLPAKLSLEPRPFEKASSRYYTQHFRRHELPTNGRIMAYSMDQLSICIQESDRLCCASKMLHGDVTLEQYFENDPRLRVFLHLDWELSRSGVSPLHHWCSPQIKVSQSRN